MRKFVHITLAVILLIALAGCKSEEEKAIDRMRPSVQSLTKAIEKKIVGRQASIGVSPVWITYNEQGDITDSDKEYVLKRKDCLTKLAEQGIIELHVTKDSIYLGISSPNGIQERYEPSVKEEYKKYIGKVDSSEVLLVGPYKVTGVESLEKFVSEWDETKDRGWFDIKAELTNRAPWYIEEVEALCPYWVHSVTINYTKANGWQ